MSLKEGSVIEFKDKKNITGVLCLKVDSKNVRVINESNKEFNLPINKISHITDHVLNISKSRADLISDLNNLINRIEEKINEINISDLWELLKDTPEEKYTLQQLTEIYFGNDASSDTRSCMLRVLVEDSIYFDIKSDGSYSPKTEKVVEQIINQKKIEEQRLKLRETSIQWLKNIWANKNISEEKPNGIEKILESLKEVAVLGNRSDKYNDVFNLLSEAGINISHSEENLIKLLTNLGIFEEDQNLLLLEYNIPLNFSNSIINEAQNINNDISKELPKRLDLRHIETITIDDEDTKDIDDAISFVENSNGYTIYIHIADAAHWVQPETLLDKEAHSRSTTMYLPERKIEMLPPNLSEDVCSLIEGQDRLSVSVIVNFNSMNEIIDFKLAESVINVNKRMSYKDADENLNNDSYLFKLSKLTDSLRTMRLNKGAIIFNLPELKIKITEDKKIILDKYKQNSPSQLLVSELMVLANSLVADFMFKNKIPCIYRHQEEPIETVNFNNDVNPVVLMYKQRRFMKKSEVSTIPQEHHGLGLKSYTQMTSQ
jgi:exoribonuclease-2